MPSLRAYGAKQSHPLTKEFGVIKNKTEMMRFIHEYDEMIYLFSVLVLSAFIVIDGLEGSGNGAGGRSGGLGGTIFVVSLILCGFSSGSVIVISPSEWHL